jgi:uncharacterized protein YndB with AHSA1/START domain
MENYIVKIQIPINAKADKVWKALTDPSIIRQYMFGTTVITDWKVGSKITWKGEWKGKPYEDHGKVLELQRGKKLKYDHMSGQSDNPEMYPTVTIELSENGNQTILSLVQDHNRTEESKAESEKNWKMMFGEMKKIVENQN